MNAAIAVPWCTKHLWMFWDLVSGDAGVRFDPQMQMDYEFFCPANLHSHTQKQWLILHEANICIIDFSNLN